MNDALAIDRSDTKEFLAELELRTSSRNEHGTMRFLIDGLQRVRVSSGNHWRAIVNEIRRHPAIATAYLCPFTRHAATRPYGYPGDAELIDYIYGFNELPEGDAAQAIFRFTSTSPACRAVRYRRALAAQLIDEVVHEAGTDAQIVSVACGRMRELELATAAPLLHSGAFLGIDQDQTSLDVAEAAYKRFGIKTLRRNVADLIAGRYRLEPATLIYSTGLYDYLSDEVARKLTNRLFGSLRPGGRLVLVNFTPVAQDIGYMEAVMDWWLIYRDAEAMHSLLREIDNTLIKAVRQYGDPSGNLTFLDVTKKGRA